ncbi:MAG: hypothetical protein K2Y18_07070 [Alphaproteobacteria bacterium]|jgi:hypothetical protein|nr:hypothetical protein [Alphaproteobacteria bacterium]
MMKQEIKFYALGCPHPRPTSTRTLYVDGAAGGEFREGIDGELSHWRPNKTEAQYRAGTSTEICFKYLHANKNLDYDLVVNNHLDVDGVMSVFALTHPKIALANEGVIVKAAEAGDFWAWAEGTAFNLFHEMSLLFRTLESSNLNLQESYKECFSLILKLLEGEKTISEAENILHQQYALVEQRKIIREELNERLVSYHVPKETVRDDMEKYLRVAKFNEPISDRLAFWPQVRNRQDAQKMHLVSVETSKGIHYDLWMPGYSWADTSGLWVPPGLIPATTIGAVNKLQWNKLTAVAKELNALETGSCHWHLFPGIVFANTKNPRAFPIILTTYADRKVGSEVSLESIKDTFRTLWE